MSEYLCKPVIVELDKTCDACPAQWEGKTSDGELVYIRYRWGFLSASTGIDSLFEKIVFGEYIGSGLDGDMSNKRMKCELREVFDFNGVIIG